MGFKISWIAFDRIGKDRALDKVGLRDTGHLDEPNESPFSGAEIPGGWFILFSNDFLFVSRERLAGLSADCSIVACRVHEGTMPSVSYGYAARRRLWEVGHDAQQGLDNLSIFGSPPPSFQSVRQSNRHRLSIA
jgi:hypothetical protein